MRQIFGEDYELLLRMGVFLYDWFDSPVKLNEAQLPPKEEFYPKLNDARISN